MPRSDITTTKYTGSLLGVDLLSSKQTILLNRFGSTQTAELVDNDNSFGSQDDGTATYGGDPVTYIGSGTAQPGIALGPITVPTGTKKDIVVFEAGGKTYFHYPDGEPNALGMIALVVDIDDVPYDGLTPVCFCKGTEIGTPGGNRKVETLKTGDSVLDMEGNPHVIRWIGGHQIDLTATIPALRDKLWPIRIPAGRFGKGRPYRDLHLSPQHRVLIESYQNDLLFGASRVLVPAKALVGDRAHTNRRVKTVDYYHILCDEHVILTANGLPCESLLLAPQSLRNLPSEYVEEIKTLVAPMLENADVWKMSAAEKALTVQESKLALAVLTTGQEA